MNKFLSLVLFLLTQVSLGATSFPIFTTLGGDFKSTDGSAIEVKNMPPMRSQDGLPICYGFSATTLYEQYSCKQSHSDCSNIPPEKAVSPIGMSILGASLEYQHKAESVNTIPYSAKGGNSVLALSLLSTSGVVESEACYPFDQFIQKHRNINQEMHDAFANLKKNYYDKNKTEASICTDCLVRELDSQFNIKTDNTKVLKALGEETFDKFLYDVILDRCENLIEPINYKLNTWPGTKKGFKYEDMISKLKSLFQQNTPVSAGGCLDSIGTTKKCKGHDFVISGYRKYCKQTPECESNCTKVGCSREALHIHNSWGQDWQDQNNDGWVDAKTLYDYLERDKDALAWLSP